MEVLCAATQPSVENIELDSSLRGNGAAGSARGVSVLAGLIADDAAGRVALMRVGLALGVFPPCQQVKPQWAIALRRLQLRARSVTVGQFERLCLMESNACYALRRLGELELVEFGPAERDARQRLVRLTACGEDWLDRLCAALAA